MKAKEIFVFCEGLTEQGFCKQVLGPHLSISGNVRVYTLAVGQKNYHHVYGLGGNYQQVKYFIQTTLKHRPGNHRRFTTMIDLYALPDDFPGKAENTRNIVNPTPYVVALEKALMEDIGDFRFIPYLQLHEYETMLFANPEAFKYSFEHCEQHIVELKRIASSVPCIEHINDGRETAPSKRIRNLIPAYQELKTSAGPDIAEYIGIATIRVKCPHIDQWLSQLESFVKACL